MSNSIKVKPEELGAVITQALKEYQQEVADDMKATCLKCAEIGASNLKVTSPYRRHKKGTKGGHYRSGWDVSVLYESNSTIRVAIHNKKKPGLVHLLEHGHAKINGGRTKALPHVAPEEEKLAGMITQEVVARFKR